MKRVDVARDFHNRLTNRNSLQGDGNYTAEAFRRKFLGFLDSDVAWSNSAPAIVLDFEGVVKIGPSFANEAFAYFTKYAKPDAVLRKILISNASSVQLMIIKEELNAGYFKLR